MMLRVGWRRVRSQNDVGRQGLADVNWREDRDIRVNVFGHQ
jgi:hypothetical protein